MNIWKLAKPKTMQIYKVEFADASIMEKDTVKNLNDINLGRNIFSWQDL